VANYSGMAKPQEYVPKPGDLVRAEGVIVKLVVVGVNLPAKTALVASPNDMSISYPVPWSKLTRLP
jgi:hypothetical protein